MYLIGLICLLQVFIIQVTIISGQCNYHQVLEVGVRYYIYNTEYPNYYQGENHCSWSATSPNSNQILVSCSVVSIPDTDSLRVTVPGYNDLEWAGIGTRYQLFTADALSMYLNTRPNTSGGRFICELTALQTAVVPTTPQPNTCDCGWRQVNRIVGGEETGVNEFPFMAGLVDLVSRMVICGSTIISERFLVTAAHCITDFNRSRLAVVVGEHDTELGNETNYIKLYFIANFIVHDSYTGGTSPNDIALMHTTQAIEFSLGVGPVCLPYTLWVTDGTYDVTVLGWGTLEFGGRSADALQKVNISTISLSRCSAIYRQDISASHICAYSPGKDACQFDSGGPAIWFDPTRQRYKYIGIVSYGQGCADDFPGVYTRVQSFIPWIERNSGVQFCRK